MSGLLPPDLEARSLPISPRNPYLSREPESIHNVKMDKTRYCHYTNMALFEAPPYKRGFRKLFVKNFTGSLVIANSYRIF